MATGLLESMDYKGGGLLERTHCTQIQNYKLSGWDCSCVIVAETQDSYLAVYYLDVWQGGDFHLKVGGAKSSGNAGDAMLGLAVIP